MNNPSNPSDSIPIYLNISNMPCVHFGHTQASACSGVIAFADSTNNTPTSWQWDFGDGGISTIQNPTHNYLTAGTYTVTLIASNVTGTDSISKVVTINSIGGPVAATCTPIITTSNLYGITNVTLNSINNTSGNAMLGYQDFTCSINGQLIAGTQYQMSITTVNTNENVNAWIDFNNDGMFLASEQVASVGSGNNIHLATISIPLTGVVLNTPLRMRVISDFYTITSPCQNQTYGQTEDYTVTILNSTAAPMADFIISSNPASLGSPVIFTDISSNGPTTWTWTMNGGSPSASVIQNPSSIFNTAGTYVIKLVAANGLGSDSVTKNLVVVNTFTMCNPSSNQSSSALNGVLFDSGGPFGDYLDNENCYFLINPPCADSIKLSFSSFSTENGYDYVRIYDGINTSGTLLYYGTGNSIPPITKALSGNMYIYFHSDGSSTDQGFAAAWTAYAQPSPPPIANFTFTPSNPPLLDTVFFTNTSSASATFWSWDFGDGVHKLAKPNTCIYHFGYIHCYFNCNFLFCLRYHSTNNYSSGSTFCKLYPFFIQY